VDSLVVLSSVHAVLAVTNNTLIRKKMWQGWAGSVIGACLYTYVNWLAGTYGSVALGVFFFVNAIIGLWQWRRDMRAILTAGLLALLATPASAGAPIYPPTLVGSNWPTLIVCLLVAAVAGIVVARVGGKK